MCKNFSSGTLNLLHRCDAMRCAVNRHNHSLRVGRAQIVQHIFGCQSKQQFSYSFVAFQLWIPIEIISRNRSCIYVCVYWIWDIRRLTHFRTDSFLFRVGEWAVKFIYNSDKRFWIVHAWIRTHWLKQFRSENQNSESRIVLSVCTSSDSISTERFFRFRAQTFVSDRSNYTISQFPNLSSHNGKMAENVCILWPRQRLENGRVRNSQQFIEGETAWKGLRKYVNAIAHN